MKSDIKNIFELLHSPVLTPYNLLENVKLDNYKYVNYYMGESGVISEMKCVDIEGEVIYYYLFDKQDHLFKVLMKTSDGKQEQLFEREDELSKHLNKYSSSKSNKTSAV